MKIVEELRLRRGEVCFGVLDQHLAWITGRLISVRSLMSVIHTRDAYDVKPSASSFGVRTFAWLAIQAG